jgi:hypothetical protein
VTFGHQTNIVIRLVRLLQVRFIHHDVHCLELVLWGVDALEVSDDFLRESKLAHETLQIRHDCRAKLILVIVVSLHKSINVRVVCLAKVESRKVRILVAFF